MESKHNETVFIALGSNLGDRLRNLARAREMMSGFVQISAESNVYETPPWGVLEQPRFFNQVVKGSTSLAPLHLLNHLKNVEKQLGRVRTVRYGPRVIDLDILLYSDRRINYKRLQVPHPRMFERAFVLVPLAELAPNLMLPGSNLTVKENLDQLDQSGIVKL